MHEVTWLAKRCSHVSLCYTQSTTYSTLMSLLHTSIIKLLLKLDFCGLLKPCKNTNSPLQSKYSVEQCFVDLLDKEFDRSPGKNFDRVHKLFCATKAYHVQFFKN